MCADLSGAWRGRWGLYPQPVDQQAGGFVAQFPLVLELGEKIERELDNKTLLACGTVSVLDSKALLGYCKSPYPCRLNDKAASRWRATPGRGAALCFAQI